MKKLSFLLIAVLIFVSTTIFAHDTKNEFKDYEIEEVNNLDLGTSVKGMWTIRYGEQKTPVAVTKHKTSKGYEYVVSSDFIQVSYVATKKGFGAKETKNSLRTVPFEISNAVINSEKVTEQKVLSPNMVDDQKALGLIAHYLPMLINDNYKQVLM